MATKQNKAIIRSFIEGLRQNLSAMDERCAVNLTCHLPGFPGPSDKETFKGFAAMLYNAFPDLHHTVEDLIAENNMVASRVTIRGTHQGLFQGIPPTGKKVAFTDMIIMRLKEGKVLELWAQFDIMSLLEQLGVTVFPDGP